MGPFFITQTNQTHLSVNPTHQHLNIHDPTEFPTQPTYEQTFVMQHRPQ